MCATCVAQQNTPALRPASADVIASDSCPISLEAKQRQRAPYLLTSGNGPATHPVYSIGVESLNASALREVTVELVGPTGLHYERTVGGFVGTGTAVERFRLTGSSNPHVAATKVTAVRWINLVQVIYADGTTWHRGPEKVCRIAPSGFVPVN